MSSPNSSFEPSAGSRSFHLLDERIQKWIWNEGWSELKDAQERAIPLILGADRDVIVAAATASGKTEAAMFPVLTHLLKRAEPGFVLYVSPLKALINDQWGRLTRLCDVLDLPVVPWHGDVAASKKKKFFENAQGVVLITPESLEALVMNKGHSLKTILAGLRYVVIDEAHAFIGSERGKQIQSLLARIDFALGRFTPRIGLSATLGDMALAGEFLRPGKGDAVEMIISRESSHGLKILVKGYLSTPVEAADAVQASSEKEETPPEAEIKLVADLFKATKGSRNLIFPNSRRMVERYTDLLNKWCEKQSIPREYWPHHGSLAKEVREETEAALKTKDRPANAVATTTLELGIDVGDVYSIAQVGEAPSVASLRQRLGRSGRRAGTSSILRGYCLEQEITKNSTYADQLRTGLVTNIAMINLLLQGWYEPPRIGGMHLSTLVQQVLSIIGQQGGATVHLLWAMLFETGTFSNMTKAEFVQLLKHLGTLKLLMQDASGLLLHGETGERIVNHYDFYASFASEAEYRLVSESRQIGSIPVSKPLDAGSYIIFAGKRWLVLAVDNQKKVIQVKADVGGRAPSFSGTGWFKRHDRVREEMRRVLGSTDDITYLDHAADELLSEARKVYAHMGLARDRVISTGTAVCLFPWKGDWVMDTLALLMVSRGMKASNEGVYIQVEGHDKESFMSACGDMIRNPLTGPEIAKPVKNKIIEKWDAVLPDHLLCQNYESHNLDVAGAYAFLTDLYERG
jgi:ATP-dependent Lhr-like helicase